MTEETLFELARKTPEAERAALLDRACEGKPELRTRVEALLRADAAASPLSKQSPLLEQTAGFSHTVAQASPDAVGTLVDGRFKLLQKLGEGGMGTVWVAEQEHPVKRRVALKLIKAGMDSAQVIRRFEAERQALALMDHTNIAKVLDAGTTDNGRPYFVMELVKGVPITKYCDEIHASIKNRLELFVQVCSAVQHAHQKGIIHRDIKPSNILVAMQDGKPVPKVIDFGVAKALHTKLADQSMYTEIGQIIGTLEYMAPEQAELSVMDIDTRADIYALGVLLYELLTGSTPITRERMKSAAFAEVIRLIKEEDPPKPSTRLTQSKESLANLAALRKTDPKHLSSELKGELDWVVLKALEKDRTCRYETANGLARDIQRYLADEVVEARPPSAGYRLRKFVRRNTGKVWAAGLIALTLLGGIAGTTWGWLKASQQEQIAHELAVAERGAKQEADRKRQEADKARDEAQRRLAQLDKGNEILTSIFSDLNVNELKKENETLESVLANRLVRAAGQLEGDVIGDTLTVAKMQIRLAQSLSNLGFLQEALALNIKADTTLSAQLRPDHPDVMEGKYGLALAYLMNGKLNEAIPMLVKLRDDRLRILGPDNPLTMGTIASLANAYRLDGRVNEAIPMMEQVQAQSEKKYGKENELTQEFQLKLATSYISARRYSEAIKIMEPLREVKLRTKGMEHPETLRLLLNLSAAYRNQGNLDGAIQQLEEIRNVQSTNLGGIHPSTLNTKHNLAAYYFSANRLPEAMVLMEEVCQGRLKKLSADHPDTLNSQGLLARCYQKCNKQNEALALFERTVTTMRQTLGPAHIRTLELTNVWAECLRQTGQFESAIDKYEMILANTKSNQTVARNEIFHAGLWLGKSYDELKNLAKSREVFEQQYRVVSQLFGPGENNTLQVGREYAYSLIKNKEYDRGEILLQELIQRRRAQKTLDATEFSHHLAEVGETLILLDRGASAETYLRECLAIRQKLTPQEWWTFFTQLKLGQALKAQGKTEQAIQTLTEGYQGLQRIHIPPGWVTAMLKHQEVALTELMELYTILKQPDEVKKWQAEKAKLPKPVERNDPRHPASSGLRRTSQAGGSQAQSRAAGADAFCNCSRPRSLGAALGSIC